MSETTYFQQLLDYASSRKKRDELLKMSDAELRAKLREITGYEAPENIKLKLHEDSSSIYHIVLPPLAKENSKDWC